MFQLTGAPVSSDAVVIFVSSIVVLPPNGQLLDCATIAVSVRYLQTIPKGSHKIQSEICRS